MQAEALASAKFLRFAAAARMEDRPRIAWLFQGAAEVARCRHFAREAVTAHMVADCTDNLRQAIVETNQQIERYSRYVSEASRSGDTREAAMFEALKADEVDALARFETALKDLEQSQNGSQNACPGTAAA